MKGPVEIYGDLFWGLIDSKEHLIEKPTLFTLLGDTLRISREFYCIALKKPIKYFVLFQCCKKYIS